MAEDVGFQKWLRKEARQHRRASVEELVAYALLYHEGVCKAAVLSRPRGSHFYVSRNRTPIFSPCRQHTSQLWAAP